MSVKATIQDQLKGNLNKKFGDNLPIPFIEKVKIEDEAITLEAAVYFNLDEYSVENFDDFKAQLGDVHFYAMMALDREYAHGTGSDDFITENMYSDIVAGKKSVLSNLSAEWSYISRDSNATSSITYPAQSTGDESSTGHNLYDLGTLSDWTLVDTYYNESGKPTNKLVNSLALDIDVLSGYVEKEGTRSAVSYARSLYSYFSNYKSAVDIGTEEYIRDRINNAGFITFSSILDLNDLDNDDYTETDAAFEDNDSMKYLYGSLVSDMNYISFFKDGAVNESKQYVYVKPDGEIVPNAVQALNGNYYAPSKVNLPKIVALFKAVSAPPIIEEGRSALATLLATNATNSTLLRQINLYLNTFFEKTSATPMGQYYLKLRKRLAAIDILVREGVKCSKQIVTNPIVQDFRGTTYTSDYEWAATYVGPDDSGFDATDYVHTPSVFMQRMTGSLEGTEEVVVDKGYLFVDYEKLLKEQSNLAHLVDVQKVEDYFGHNILTSNFYLDQARMRLYKKKTGGDSSDTQHLYAQNDDGVYSAYYDNGADVSNWTKTQRVAIKLEFGSGSEANLPLEIEYKINDGKDIDNYYIVSLEGANSTLQSYLKLRNFNLPVADTLVQDNGEFYKLMCFEFQSIISEAFWGQSSDNPYSSGLAASAEEIFLFDDMYYLFDFTINDDSLEVFDHLRTIAKAARRSFNDYADIALDHCSYNNTDNVFNQFFINAVEAKFGTEPSSCPFLYAPLVYNYLLDIFTNAFDGDKLEIFEATRKLSDTIAPYAGTRDAVETFQANFKDLIDSFLDKTGKQYYKKTQDGSGYPESVGSWGTAPTQFEISSAVTKLLWPVNVDLEEYSTATMIEASGGGGGGSPSPEESESGGGGGGSPS